MRKKVVTEYNTDSVNDATVFLHEYIHEKGEEQSLPYCNKTCYVNCWMSDDCETPCAECKNLARRGLASQVRARLGWAVVLGSVSEPTS